jgi:hypothetical protein
MFESVMTAGTGVAQRVENTWHLVEIATPWSYQGRKGNTLMTAYQDKVEKYGPLRAEVEVKKPGYKCGQTTIIVSPTGALLRESLEKLAKISKLPRGRLAIHGRCIVDAAIQGAYEQWRQFGR